MYFLPLTCKASFFSLNSILFLFLHRLHFHDRIDYVDYTAMSEKDDHDHRSTRSHSTSDGSSDTNDPASRTPSLARGVAESVKSKRMSKSSPDEADLDRVHSARYPDDNAVYHSHEEDDHDMTDDSSLEAAKVDTIQEVRGGIVNERDVDLERGQQPASELEQTRTLKSTKSRHGGKLVSSDLRQPLALHHSNQLSR